jgi:hypothetical protein
MSTTTKLLAGLALATGLFTPGTIFARASQQPTVEIHDDDITIRGCVSRTSPGNFTGAPVLVWTRGDIMLSNALAVSGGKTAPITDRVFYWLDDDDDEDLAKHVGQLVEVKGDLGDFKKGEVEVDRDGDYTKIEMKIGGKTEKAKVPTAWLGAPVREGDFDIVTRKVDVDKVKVLGACPVR